MSEEPINSEPISDEPRDNFAAVEDAEFEALARTGDYKRTDSDCLSREENGRFFFVMRQREWDRLQRIRQEVEAEIEAQEAGAERRGM